MKYLLLLLVLVGCTTEPKLACPAIQLETIEIMEVNPETCASGKVWLHSRGFDLNCDGQLQYDEATYFEFPCVEE